MLTHPEYPCELCGVPYGSMDKCVSCGGEHSTCFWCYGELINLGLAEKDGRTVSVLYGCPTKELLVALTLSGER